MNNNTSILITNDSIWLGLGVAMASGVFLFAAAKKILLISTTSITTPTTKPKLSSSSCHRHRHRHLRQHSGSSSVNSTIIDDHYPIHLNYVPLCMGLNNLGNTCFFNSVIQCLATLDPLIQFLITSVDNGAHDDSISATLLELLNVLRVPHNSRKSIAPKQLIFVLVQSNHQLLNMRQQDAHELFQVVSDIINREWIQLHETYIKPSLSDIITWNNNNTLSSSTIAIQSQPINHSPFTGWLVSRFACIECNYCPALRHFIFDNLTLTLPLSTTVSLETILHDYTSLEYIDGANCRRCSLRKTLSYLQLEWMNAQSIENRLIINLNQYLNIEKPSQSQQRNNNNNNYSRRSGIRKRKKLNHKPHQHKKQQHLSIKSSSVDTIIDDTTTILLQQQHKLAQEKSTELKQSLNYIEQMLQWGKEEIDIPSNIKLIRTETRHTKQLMIARLPPLLVLHINRSAIIRNYVVKNSCTIHIPEYLDLASVCSGPELMMNPLQSMKGINRILTKDNSITNKKNSLLLPHRTCTQNIILNTSIGLNNHHSHHSCNINKDTSITYDSNNNDLCNNMQVPPTPPETLTPNESPSLINLSPLPIDADNNHNNRYTPPCTPLLSQEILYQLQSIVVHYGNHDYGHYICYRRAPSSSSSSSSSKTTGWLRVSDNQVISVPVSEVLACGDNATLLFYEKM